MEINKENFISEISEFTGQFMTTGIYGKLSELDRHEIYIEKQEKINFILDCINRLYLQGEFELLKNSYNIICIRELEFIQYNIEDLDHTLILRADWIDEPLEPIKVKELFEDNLNSITKIKECLEKYIDIIEPIRIEKSSDKDKMQDIQKAYFFYYLFKNINQNTARTDYAKIASTLLGKSLNDKGYNENIYTYLRAPFESDKPILETRIVHLKEVKKMFEVLNAESIVKEIDYDIEYHSKK